MRNFFQKILILFTGNNYPEATQNEFYQWLVDEDHASQKEDALRELWNKAQRQKNVKGMQKSYERLKKQEGIPTVPKERSNPQLLSYSSCLPLRSIYRL